MQGGGGGAGRGTWRSRICPGLGGEVGGDSWDRSWARSVGRYAESLGKQGWRDRAWPHGQPPLPRARGPTVRGRVRRPQAPGACVQVTPGSAGREAPHLSAKRLC